MANSFKLLFTGVLILSVGACIDQSITGQTEPGYQTEVKYRIVRVSYPSPFGPEAVDDMYTSSVKKLPAPGEIQEGKLPPTAFGCHSSWPNPDKDPNYKYYTHYIYMPDEIIKSAHNRYKYVTVRALSPEGPNGKSMGMIHCMMPYVPNIEQMVKEFYKATGERRSPEVDDIRFTTEVHEIDPDDY